MVIERHGPVTGHRGSDSTAIVKITQLIHSQTGSLVRSYYLEDDLQGLEFVTDHRVDLLEV
jgi:hypothetical protein